MIQKKILIIFRVIIPLEHLLCHHLTPRSGLAAEGTKMGSQEGDVYRISTLTEWEELQKAGSVYGGPLDISSGFIHLSTLNQVKSTLLNFFTHCKEDLYLLQIDANKLGDGLVYEAVDACSSFPHFYGPSRSFSPLPLNVVTKAEKLSLSDGQFTCSLLD